MKYSADKQSNRNARMIACSILVTLEIVEAIEDLAVTLHHVGDEAANHTGTSSSLKAVISGFDFTDLWSRLPIDAPGSMMAA